MVGILVQALSLVAVVGIGVGIKRLGWVSAADFPKFAMIVLRITLPCALATSFNKFDIPWSLLLLAAVGFVVNIVQELTAFVRVRRREPVTKAFAILHGGSYNIGAFAIPYTSAFLGPQAIVYASIFDVGNSLSAAGVGYGWARSTAEPGTRTTVGRFLGMVFRSPVFDTYLFLVVMRLLNLHLPGPIVTFTTLVGAANPFLSMLMIGIGLELRLARSKLVTAAKFLALRYAFAVVFSLLVWHLLPGPAEMRMTLVMIFFAPIASMIPGMTADIRGDIEIAAFMNSVSIVVAIIAMPLLFFGLSAI